VYGTVEAAAEFGLDISIVRLDAIEDGTSFPEVRARKTLSR
jgi:hypothetical protein